MGLSKRLLSRTGASVAGGNFWIPEAMEVVTSNTRGSLPMPKELNTGRRVSEFYRAQEKRQC